MIKGVRLMTILMTNVNTRNVIKLVCCFEDVEVVITFLHASSSDK